MESLLSSIPVALAVISYLAYQDWRDGKFDNRNNIEDVGDAERLVEMQKDMSHLRLHFNDELTALLTSMQIAQGQQTKILEKISDSMVVVLNRQNEMMTYGVTCRKLP